MRDSIYVPDQQAMATTRRARTSAHAVAAATRRDAARPEGVRRLNVTELHVRMAGLKLEEAQVLESRGLGSLVWGLGFEGSAREWRGSSPT